MHSQQNRTSKRHFLFYIVAICSSFILLVPAFFNGYPLLNNDFGSFLPSGFLPEMPVDRPIAYGILLRLFSLNGLSMWLVIFVQAFFVSVLLLRLIRHFFPDKYLAKAVIVIPLLALTTGLSWTVCQLQPDIFTPVAFLCLALLLIAQESRRIRVVTYTIYFVAICTHISHVMIFFALLCGAMILFRRNFREQKRRYYLLLILTVVPYLSMTVPIAKSSHMFLMATLLDKGILKQYLNDNCAAKRYQICSNKDKLPASGDDFLWDPSSIAMQQGGWKAVRPEYSAINNDILTTPRYLGIFLSQTLRYTGRQIACYDIGPGIVPLGGSQYVVEGFEKYLPSELDNFRNARQQSGSLLQHTIKVNSIFKILAGAFTLAALFLVMDRRLNKGAKLFFLLSFLCILINAADCAAFSMVNGRYGCRVIWLMTLSSLILLLSYFDQRKGFGQIS